MENPEKKHKPENLRTSKIHVFNDSSEAMEWLKTNISPSDSITLLPYLMAADQVVKREQWENGIYFDLGQRRIYVEKSVPIAISEVTVELEKRYGLLAAEMNMESLGNQDTITVYRGNNTDDIPSILRHGFFQLPGRSSFLFPNTPIFDSLTWQKSTNPDSIALAFALPSRILGTDSQNAGIDAAFLFLPSIMGAGLPDDLRTILQDSVAIQTDTALFSKERMLLLAEDYGFLVHATPDTIDRRRTLALNHERMQKGIIGNETYTTLEKFVQD